MGSGAYIFVVSFSLTVCAVSSKCLGGPKTMKQAPAGRFLECVSYRTCIQWCVHSSESRRAVTPTFLLSHTASLFMLCSVSILGVWKQWSRQCTLGVFIGTAHVCVYCHYCAMKLYREMLHVHICFDCRVLQYDIGTCDVPTRIFMYSLLTGHIFNAHNSWLLENDSECAVIQYTSGLPWAYLGIWGDTMDAHRQLEAWTLWHIILWWQAQVIKQFY